MQADRDFPFYLGRVLYQNQIDQDLNQVPAQHQNQDLDQDQVQDPV